MAYYVYVLRSTTSGRFYVGSTQDPQRRIAEHNRGKVLATRGRGPWEMAYREEHATRADAMRRERGFKRMKSRARLLELLSRQVG